MANPTIYSTSNSGTGSTASVSIDSNRASGDLLIFAVTNEDATATGTSITGWTHVGGHLNYARIFYKISDGTETSVSYGLSSSDEWAATCIVANHGDGWDTGSVLGSGQTISITPRYFGVTGVLFDTTSHSGRDASVVLSTGVQPAVKAETVNAPSGSWSNAVEVVDTNFGTNGPAQYATLWSAYGYDSPAVSGTNVNHRASSTYTVSGYPTYNYTVAVATSGAEARTHTTDAVLKGTSTKFHTTDSVLVVPQATTQEAFRFRTHDNASVAANSTLWGADQNANLAAVNPGRRFRLRMQWASSGSYSTTYKLQYRINAGTWTDVGVNNPGASEDRTTVSAVEIVANSGYTDAAATTDQLTGGTGSFVAGQHKDTGITTGTIALNASHTECEWSLWVHRLDSNAAAFVSDGDTIQFRVVESDNTPLDTYSVTPQITVDIPAGYAGGQFVENPAQVGPFEDGNGNLYFVSEPYEHSPQFVMWKSTDSGDTWQPVDMANNPAADDCEGVSIRQAGTVLHIGHWGGSGGVDGVYYHRFATSDDGTNPDSWVEADTVIDDNLGGNLARRDQAVTLEVLSNGDLVCLYHYDSGTSAWRIGMRRRISGTWDTSTTDVWTNTDGDWLGVTSCLDPTNNIVYAFANDDALGNLYGKRITSAGTIQDLFGGSGTGDGTTVATGNSNIDIEQNYAQKPIFWNDGSDRVYLAYIVDASRRLAGRLITVGSGGSVGSEVLISDASNYVVCNYATSRQPAAAIVRDSSSGDLYAFFARTATADGANSDNADFYYSTSTNDGTSWATDTLLGERGWGSAAGYINAGSVTGGIGFVYQSTTFYEQDAGGGTGADHGNFGGFIWYDELSLATTDTVGHGWYHFDGQAAGWVETPDHASFPAGDLDIRICAALDDRFGNYYDILAAHGNPGATDGAWTLRRAPGYNGIQLSWRETGGTIRTVTSDTFMEANSYSRPWMRATLDVDDGSGNRVVTFYYSTDPLDTDPGSVSWTQIGSPSTTAGTTSVNAASVPLTIGGELVSGTGFLGNIYRFQLRDGIGGTVVANPDFTVDDQSGGDSTGKVWTSRSAWRYGTGITTENHYHFNGVSTGYVKTTENAGFPVAGDDIDVRVALWLDDYLGGYDNIVSTGDPGLYGWALRKPPSNNTLQLSWRDVGGSTITATSTSAFLPDEEDIWVRCTLDTSNGSNVWEVRFYYSYDPVTTDPGSVTWTQVGSPVTGGSSTNVDVALTGYLGVGNRPDATPPDEALNGRVYRMQLRNGIDGTVAVNPDFTTNDQSGGGDDPVSLGSGVAYSSGAYTIGTTANDFLTVPNASLADPTGDMELIAYVAYDDWSPASWAPIITKHHDTGDLGYLWQLRSPSASNSSMRLEVYDASNTIAVNQTSDAFTEPTGGAGRWVRVVYDADNGASGHDVTFYTSTDASTTDPSSVSWTQVGSVKTGSGAITSHPSTTADTRLVGTTFVSNQALAASELRQVQIKYGGVEQFRLDSSLVDSVGNVWIANDGNASYVTQGSDYYLFDGMGSSYMYLLDNNRTELQYTQLDVVVNAMFTDNSAKSEHLMSRYGGSSGSHWGFYRDANQNIRLRWNTQASLPEALPASSACVVYDTARWYRATFNALTGAYAYYYSTDASTTDPASVSWTSAGSGTVSPSTIYFNAASTTPITVGNRTDGGTTYSFTGRIYHAELRPTVGGTAVAVFDPSVAEALWYPYPPDWESGSHVTDAVLKGTFSVSHTSDAVLTGGFLTEFHTTDAVLIATETAAHTSDAVLISVESKTHTADAILLATETEAHTADAILLAIGTETHTADAILLATEIESHTSDAVLLATEVETHTSDAILIATESEFHNTDAILLATETEAHTSDAVLVATETEFHTADAILSSTETIAHTSDAILKKTVILGGEATVFSDTFTGTNGDPWNSAYWDVTLGTTAEIDIQSNTGRIRHSVIDSDYYVYSQASVANLEITGWLNAESGVDSVYIGFRSDLTESLGSYQSWSNNQYFLELYPGSGQWKLRKSVAYTAFDLDGPTTVSATNYKFRIRASGTTIQAKVWDAAGAEPGAWTFEATDSSHSSGYVRLSHYTGSGEPGLATYYDDFVLVDLDAGSHTTDAVFLATQTEFHTADAVLAATETIAHTTDAVLRSTETRDHTFDAVLSAETIVSVNIASESETAYSVAGLVAQTVNVVASAESETANNIYGDVYISVASAAESESAQTVNVAAATSINVVAASETESAYPVAAVPVLSQPITGASESEAANQITAAVQVVVTAASEIESAVAVSPIAGAVSIAVNNASETEAANTVDTALDVGIGTSSESETTNSVSIVLSVSSASETETARTVSANTENSTAVFISLETESANTITAGRTVAVSAASESETASSISSDITYGVVAASETESAVAVAVAAQEFSDWSDWQQGTTGGTQLVSVNAASETETANPIYADVVAAVTGATETEFAYPVTTEFTVSITGASETETATAITADVTAGVQAAAESETVYPVVANRFIAVTGAAESESANTITADRQIGLTASSETETANTVTAVAVASVPVGTASESETAESVNTGQTVELGTASETESANPVGIVLYVGSAAEAESATEVSPEASISVAVVAAAETETASGIYPAYGVTGAAESEAANPVRADREFSVNVASESDSALPVGYIQQGGPQVIPVSRYIESETANTVSPVPGAVSYDIGQASEFESANAVTPVSITIISVGAAAESETTNAVVADRVFAVGLSSESETAQTVSPATSITIGIGSAAESESAWSATSDLTYPVGLAAETELGRSVEADTAGSVSVGASSETEAAYSISAISSATVPIGAASETESQFQVSADQTLNVNAAAETETARTVSPNTEGSAAVFTVYETETAGQITPISDQFISVGTAAESEAAIQISISVSAAINVSSEAETAGTVTPEAATSITVGAASETEFVYPVSGAGTTTVPVTLAEETETAIAVNNSILQQVIFAAESEALYPVSIALGLVEAPETETAIAIRFYTKKLVLFGSSKENRTTASSKEYDPSKSSKENVSSGKSKEYDPTKSTKKGTPLGSTQTGTPLT